MSETLVLGLLLVLVVFLVGLPLVRRLAVKLPRASPRPPDMPPAVEGDDERREPSAPRRLGRIEGQVGRHSLKTVGDIVVKHPDEAVSVLRRWIRSGRPPES